MRPRASVRYTYAVEKDGATRIMGVSGAVVGALKQGRQTRNPPWTNRGSYQASQGHVTKTGILYSHIKFILLYRFQNGDTKGNKLYVALFFFKAIVIPQANHSPDHSPLGYFNH